jgi:hypothetical protein
MGFTGKIGSEQSLPGNILLGGVNEILVSAHTQITFIQGTAMVIDYLTAFDKVIPLLGFTPDTQGTHALVYAILQLGSKIARREGAYNGPCNEVLSRLGGYGVNAHAMKFLEQFMNTAAEQYNRR